MILLAVDTSHAGGSLAIATGDGVHQVKWIKKAMHSEVATLELENVLKDSGQKLNSLTHLAANVGPGSFTGLRVGLNLARALGFSLGLPVMGLSSLAVLAHKNAAPGESILVASKAVQNYFYMAAFDGALKPLVEPASMVREEMDAVIRRWHPTKVLIEGETPNFTPETDARDLVQAATAGRIHSSFFSWQDVKPLYVRGSEAEEKMRRGLLKPV
ncbi:MAG TPA: tRNA (adenosine(37)-N6)-threonylcarbamoyltransferase complex dimerization subunit type 1 TsaB [Bdellovibrionales bacterium]|nr:tRNA (adenosine(37)-N6)-threonylcarbamoyltransferase complex dimerization subunit type 1 TsaB [Bdellovibrionales bacterium]